MTNATPNPILTPEAAAALTKPLLTKVPPCESGKALVDRSRHGTGPPNHLVAPDEGSKARKLRYDTVEVRAWCESHMPARMLYAFQVLERAEHELDSLQEDADFGDAGGQVGLAVDAVARILGDAP